ncbi:MAG: RES family NAD+ phosphorylase [Acidimicrobiales bacterium]
MSAAPGSGPEPDLASPPDDAAGLRAFPKRRLRSGIRLYRIHRAPQGPFWFASSPEGVGRFDVPRPSGACYLALSGEAAFLEALARRPKRVIPAEEVERRRLTVAPIPRDLTDAANLPVKAARAFGLTGEIHSTIDYEITRSWARALLAAGHRAIVAIPRHDVTGKQRSVTLLDRAGDHPPFGWAWRPETGPVPPSLVERMERWGIRVVPIPFDLPVTQPG